MAKKGIVWTPEKENFVEENYLMMTDCMIAECLQCAESTVNKKVNDLGLRRPSFYKSPNLHLSETPLLKKIKKKIRKNKLKIRTNFAKLAN